MTSPVESTTGNRQVFEDSIEVPAPVGEVYRRWSDFQHFPDFMENVESVQPLGNNRYHWTARIFGIKEEWDAEVTDQEPNARISWRNTAGAYNQGTVSFSPLSSGNTEVRLRLEYAPPGGKTGQALDKVTQATRREVSEDLYNFKRLFTGEMAELEMYELVSPEGVGPLLARIAVPATAGVIGGIVGYNLERNARAHTILPGRQTTVEGPAAIAGWAFTAASAASIAASAALRLRGDRVNSLFVGQWAPTLLEAGILARAVGHKGVRTPIQTAGTSWGFAAACLGSIAASAVMHARGGRTAGLFVGQWAPTFLGAALLARLIDR